MPKKIVCCLCSRNVATNKPRVRIGSDSVWPLIEIHVDKNGLDIHQFSTENYICMKCYAMVSHYRMSDRGPNKRMKISQPVDPLIIITKNVLRSALRSEEIISDSDAGQQGQRISLMNENIDDGENLQYFELDNIHFSLASHQPSEVSVPPVQKTEQNSIACSDQSILELFNGDSLSVQNDSNLQRILSAGNAADVDYAVNLDIQESLRNDCVDESRIFSVKTDVKSISKSHESKSLINWNMDPENVEYVDDVCLYNSVPNSSSSTLESYEEEIANNDDHSVLVSLHIECLESNDENDTNTEEFANIIDSEFDSHSTISTSHLIDNENSINLNETDYITLKIPGIKSTESQCFICKSKTGRSTIPWQAIVQVWFELKIYVPKTNRSCKEHIDESKKFKKEILQKIKATQHTITARNDDFVHWLHGISDLRQSRPCNLENYGIDPEQYEMFFGINRENFDDLLRYLSGMRNTGARSVRSALGMFLTLLRNNMKQELIAYHFSTTQQVVSQAIESVSITLEQNFVPRYLGYHHITREEALQKHSVKLTTNVLNKSDDCLCVIADCTYNYIEKPTDHELQRKTFSAHKKRNLLKPLYIVLPSGYILEAAGPYFCDAKNNDAANIRHHYENSDLLLFLEEDDCFIFDRGFRDVVVETEAKGQSVVMPSLLTGKRTHFECSEANSSRKVTMNRWVVEAVNGRVKNIFPFFKHTIEGSYVPKIMRFNRIACAVINKYSPPLFQNKEFHGIISDVVKNEIVNVNEFKNEIERIGQRMSSRWERASENTVVDFPKLTIDDLQRITLGSYQLKMAEQYIKQHMKNDSHFAIYVHRQNHEIIRTQFQSRFSNSKVHNSWVKFDRNQNGFGSIKGMYCTCKVGERTLGCCSHLAAVVRYFGFERNQPPRVVSRSRSAWDAIDCAHYDENELMNTGDETE